MAVNVSELIADPNKLADRVVLHKLGSMLEQYPYFQTARLLYLKGLYLLHDPKFGEELQRTALYISDRKVLFYLIEGEHYALKPVVRKARVAEESTTADRTLTLIDAFLNGLPVEEEEAEVAVIDDGGLSSDYTSYVLREEEFSAPQQSEEPQQLKPMKGQQLIDEFIKNADEKFVCTTVESKMDETPVSDMNLLDEEEDESCFTETLAKIYIKQHRYAKALEIIRRLSLKYPKKNAYFADQIRFLEKLVINSNDK